MSNSNLIRIVIADEFPVIRQGLKAIIERKLDITDMIVVGEASNGHEAIELFSQLLPDILLIDLRIPKVSGATVVKSIRAQFNNANILVWTTYDNQEDIYYGIKAGAKGYLLKNAESHDIIKAIRTVANAKIYIPGANEAKLKRTINNLELSVRELEVLSLIANGKSNQQISAVLFITEGTVKFHVNKILSKLEVKDRSQAALLAWKRGMINV
ncbi:LuxR family two component transcriptional regulator [Calothrix sp. NIES-4071]|nr:LuxR family two component transcriptional regulator [Calothrix sp. NIES-4071]BAZ59399.1 LuxR family two component transcriptional regulator [Calothrix sp. NIES-4105]